MPKGFQALFLSVRMVFLLMARALLARLGRLRAFGDVVRVEVIARGQPKFVPLDGDAHDGVGETVGDQRAREAALAVGVEPHDRIGERLDRRTRRAVAIGMALADDDAALVVERHRDRIDDDRIGGDQLDLEILRHDEVLELLLGGERVLTFGSTALKP